jgi:dolichol-phosphate mannosyltransferase
MPALDLSVVIPTYNEAGSLPELIPRIVGELNRANLSGEVIVVDDNSPDGTAEVAQSLALNYPVRVLKRTSERGLSTAVLAGFKLSEAPVCAVIDADGSHPVSALPQMVRAILEDRADIVVGSRHVAGGGIRNWPLFSQFKSWFAATLARGLSSLSDPTSGYMAVRRQLLQDLPLDPVGWKIVLEIAVKAPHARIAEVPIVFSDRERGESKQSLRVMAQYLNHCYKLYAFRYAGFFEFVRFCIVGFIGVFVDLSVVAALKESLALDTRWCAVGGFSVAVTTNYLINRFWSFKKARLTPWIRSYAIYVGANVFGLGLRVGVIHFLMRVAGIDRGYGYLASNFLGIAVATLFNFVGAKYFAFGAPELAFKTVVSSKKGAKMKGNNQSVGGL